MKIRTKIRTKVSLENILFYLALFCVSSYALLEHTSIALSLFSYVKFPLMILGGLCVFTQVNLIMRSVLKKKFFYVLMLLALLCAALLLSAYFDRNSPIGESPMYDTMRFILFLVELFGVMIWAAETGRAEKVIDFLFRYVLILVLITDALFFSRLMVFYSGRHEIYLVGTKFDVSYMHMNLLTLWYVRNNMSVLKGRKRRRVIILSALFLVAVSIRVNCMTGVIGCVALFIFFMMLNTRVQRQFVRFTQPSFMVLFLAASVIFPFISEWIVSLPGVSYVVEEVMGRDSTLTGRVTIFEEFLEKTHGHMLWGFGYGNGYAVAEQLFDVANAQNALLHWVLQTGIITTLVLCVFMVYIIRQTSRSPRQKQVLPLVVLIYVYIILGTVETTFNMNYILWLALVFMCITARRPRAES